MGHGSFGHFGQHRENSLLEGEAEVLRGQLLGNFLNNLFGDLPSHFLSPPPFHIFMKLLLLEFEFRPILDNGLEVAEYA